MPGSQERVGNPGEDIYILFQQVLETLGAALAPAEEPPRDIHDGGKDVTCSIREQSWSIDVIHLGNLMVDFDEMCCRLLSGESGQAVLDNRAQGGLRWWSIRQRLSS